MLFIILNITALAMFMLVVFIYLKIRKHKAQFQYAFLITIILEFIWVTGQLLDIHYYIIFKQTQKILVDLYFLGICFVPAAVLFSSIIYKHTKISFQIKYILLIIFPIADYLIFIFKNELFYKHYGYFNNNAVYGSYFPIHTAVLYTYIIAAAFNFINISSKNTGLLSKQSLLMFFSFFLPFLTNIIYVSGIFILPNYITSLSFIFSTLLFWFSIVKYKFLNILPIALSKAVDHISDGFVIINSEFTVVDYNKTFDDMFGSECCIRKNINFFEYLKIGAINNIDADELKRSITEISNLEKTVQYEGQLADGRYFIIEVAPIFSNQNFIGTIVLFRDITVHKEDLELIKRTQERLIEKERLAALGELTGGIAHDINTPLNAIRNFSAILERLTDEYKESIDDTAVSKQDHKMIAQDMENYIKNINSTCEYMSDIIQTVKNHTKGLREENIKVFFLMEVIDALKILLNSELTKNNCILIDNVDKNIVLKSDFGKLNRVLANLINNAIHSYDGCGGKIEICGKIVEDRILISVKDYGKGISDSIKEKLLKEMLTTKTTGTGIGLYISKSIITGHLEGRMWFESELEKGTTFYISLPAIK